MTSHEHTRAALLEAGVPESMIAGPAWGEWAGGAIVAGARVEDEDEGGAPADDLATVPLLLLDDGTWLAPGRGSARTDIGAATPWPLIEYHGICKPRVQP